MHRIEHGLALELGVRYYGSKRWGYIAGAGERVEVVTSDGDSVTFDVRNYQAFSDALSKV